MPKLTYEDAAKLQGFIPSIFLFPFLACVCAILTAAAVAGIAGLAWAFAGAAVLAGMGALASLGILVMYMGLILIIKTRI